MKKQLHPPKQLLKSSLHTLWLTGCFILFFCITAHSQTDVYIPSSQIRLISSTPISSARNASPTSVSPNALYSNVTNFSGSGFKNGGAANQSGNTITRLVADSLGFISSPPYTIGSFSFS